MYALFFYSNFNNMTDYLRACPFCGRFDSVRIHKDENDKYYIGCSNCLSRGKKFNELEMAVAQWNDRYHSTQETIKFRPICDEFQTPKRNGAAYDIFQPETFTIKPGQTLMVGLGFSCKLPTRHHAILTLRSSTWKNYNVRLGNQIGVIDNNYSGDLDEWKALLYMPEDQKQEVTIKSGTRILQFLVYPDASEFVLETVPKLDSVNRGGFGSTGI